MIFCIYQVQLAWIYIKNKKKRSFKAILPQPAQLPYVTIQLPVYNEKYMVERLLENIVKINYPKEKLQVQILDDSTDETTDIIQKKIEDLKETQVDFQYLHRDNRKGFKAGALEEGLKTAKGELIAIFDADFLPEPDFLLKTIPYFADQKIGAIQTRWGHLNKDFSLLTKIQAFALDVHFTIEKIARNTMGYFIEFNGTAGIWRKEAILDAGNWQADTLTEDLDISYRTQLKGWKIKYLEDVITPAELPIEMNAIKVQQFRWMKGGAQNLVKYYKNVIRAQVPFMTKLNSLIYLSSSSIFLFSFLVAILTFPVMMIQMGHQELKNIFSAAIIFTPVGVFPFFYYGIAYFSVNKLSLKSVLLFPFYFFFFLAVFLGLSFNNLIAVMEAYLRIKSSFIRTPKFNINTKSELWKKNKYLSKGINVVNVLEFLLAIFFLTCIILSIHLKQYTFLSFFITLFLGYSLVFFLSIKKATL
jgi:cellulose synthase/poly-beta-1,6-N-acetylglucosamine synthase-like glycosyltransferase